MHADAADLFAAASAAIDALRGAGAPEATPEERSAAAALTPTGASALSRPVAGIAGAQTGFHAVDASDLARIALKAACGRLEASGWRARALGPADAAGLLAAIRAERRATEARPIAFVAAGPSSRGSAPERTLLHALFGADGGDGLTGVALSTDGRDHAASPREEDWVAGGVATQDRARRLAQLAPEADAADAFDALGDALRLGALNAPRLGLRLLALRA